MALQDMVRQHQDHMNVLSLQASSDLMGLWRQVDPDRIRESWLPQVPRATSIVGNMQIRAAEESAIHSANLLEEQGISPAGPRINQYAFAGASMPMRPGGDPTPLDVAMASPAFHSLQDIGRGVVPERALAGGFANLTTRSQTAIADSGRSAQGLVSSSREAEVLQARHIQPGACDRCVILAGRLYRDASFERHPGCACTAIPTNAEMGESLATDPYAYFESMDAEQQEATFGKSNARAIRDGADIFQVTNSRMERFHDSSGAEGTRYGTTRRAHWGRRRQRRTRLTPDQIYQTAGTRTRAQQMLRDYGYIIGDQDSAGVLGSSLVIDKSLPPDDQRFVMNLAFANIHRI